MLGRKEEGGTTVGRRMEEVLREGGNDSGKESGRGVVGREEEGATTVVGRRGERCCGKGGGRGDDRK